MDFQDVIRRRHMVWQFTPAASAVSRTSIQLTCHGHWG
jgi:hypothetical protein